MLNIEITNS